MQSISKYLVLEGNIRVLAAQTFVSQIGLGMFYVIWQPYLLSTGITVSQLGLVQTMINISTAVGLIVWGQVSDRIGRKPGVIGSAICRTLAILVLIVSGHYYALMVFGFFIGFSAMFMIGNPARNALIAESVESSKTATALSTLITISQGISTLVAGAGGYIALKMGYMPIFYVTVVGDLVGSFLLWKYIEETHTPESNDTKQVSLSQQIKDMLVPERTYMTLYISMLLQGFSYAVAYSLFYGALTDTYGFNTFQLGLLSTSFNLVWAVDSIPLGKLVDRIGHVNGMIMSFAMAFVSVMGFILFNRIEFFIIFNGFSAIDIGFWMPSYMSFVTGLVPQDRRSTVMGKLDAYGRLGAIPAPWLGGLLYDNYGFDAPLYVQAVILVINAAIINSLRGRDSS
jgi:DHA1 family multidrug resistance protein-like MFS transporter